MNDPYRHVYRNDFLPEHYVLAPHVDRPEDDEWGDWAYTGFVFRYEGDVPVEYVGCDGGEPEDQTLARNWSWVLDALNREARRG